MTQQREANSCEGCRLVPSGLECTSARGHSCACMCTGRDPDASTGAASKCRSHTRAREQNASAL